MLAVVGVVAVWLAIVFTTQPSNAGTVCEASYYGGGKGEHLSKYTSNGDVFNHRAMTAAHRSLPFGSKVRVTLGSRSVVVTVNDRGPARSTGRCIDLSRGAASALGMIRRGTAHVRIETLN